jgi:NAD(P) transhydrogenase subunit beta
MLASFACLIVAAAGLAAASLFPFGLLRMASTVTAPAGIRVAGVGMVVVMLASFRIALDVDAAARPHLPVNIGLALLALALGGGVAWWSGRTVAMTAMAKMVALYNGAGGGAVSLSGSLIAWAKLDDVIERPLRVKGQQAINTVAMAARLALGGWIVCIATGLSKPAIALPILIYAFFGCALVLGVLMTLLIGGADMPVVISIDNAFTGLAVALEVPRAAEPRASDRRHGGGRRRPAADAADGARDEPLREQYRLHELRRRDGPQARRHPGRTQADCPRDAGVAMRYASSAIVGPGYGLSVAQGQQKLFEFVRLLQAGAPYDAVFQLEDINGDFPDSDALIIGANDVVNPAARTDKAKKVSVVKRGKGIGYADVVNTLFYADSCSMVYGDAQAVPVQMIKAVKSLGRPLAA